MNESLRDLVLQQYGDLPEGLRNPIICVGPCRRITPHWIEYEHSTNDSVSSISLSPPKPVSAACAFCGAKQDLEIGGSADQCRKCGKSYLIKSCFGMDPKPHICNNREPRIKSRGELEKEAMELAGASYPPEVSYEEAGRIIEEHPIGVPVRRARVTGWDADHGSSSQFSAAPSSAEARHELEEKRGELRKTRRTLLEKILELGRKRESNLDKELAKLEKELARLETELKQPKSSKDQPIDPRW